MARLGEILLEEELLGASQLAEGLETQVVYGGRLGTNLVELGFLKEPELARSLGRQHGMPYASGEMIPDPAALAVVDARFQDDHDLLPMRIDATRLTVAVLGPGPLQPLDDLGFKVGKRIVPVVIPEFRMNQLLRKHCQAFRPMRPIDMNTLRPSKQAGEKKAVAVDDLINEDDFAKIYASAMEGAPEVVLEAVLVEESGPMNPVSAPMPSLSPPGSARPEPPPLAFADAQALLQKSTDREDLATTVLRLARAKFVRALLLSVRGDLLSGWRGMGQGVRQRSVQRIGVSLREANTFAMVRDLRSHFVGPMKRTPGTDVFYELLGGGYPTTAVLLPLLVRGKPVHLLYVDAGPAQLTPPDVGELLIVSQSVSRSYDTLIRARQAKPT